MSTGNNQTNDAALVKKDFVLPVMTTGQFSQEDLEEDIDGLQLSFPRVKIPAGGVLQFELVTDDPEHPEYISTLEAVILYNHAYNAYWQENEDNDDDEDTVPLCSSVDGKIGFGMPGGTCITCEFNQYGSDEKGRGKACKNMRPLYLLRSGDYMPTQLTLPPTSIKPFSEFLNMAFTVRRRATWGSLVEIGLKRATNSSGIVYSVATFKKLRDFEGEELAEIKALALELRTQIKQMQEQRADEAASRAIENGCTDCEVTDQGDEFEITADKEIDGDREELPA